MRTRSAGEVGSWWILWPSALTLLVIMNMALTVAALRSLGIVYRHLDGQERAPGGQAVPPAAVGDLLPDVIPETSGRDFNLAAYWEQGPLVLLAVSFGCVACRDALMSLGHAHVAMKSQGITCCVLATGPSALLKYLMEDASVPSDIPVVSVAESVLESLMRVRITPSLLVCDSEGKVTDVALGQVEEGHLRQVIVAAASIDRVSMWHMERKS